MPTPKKPPMKASDEATLKQLDMAKAQGASYKEALMHMAKEEADDGGEKRAGDYIVAYAVEKAEGMYHMEKGSLMWHEPAEKENCHIEIAVRDASDNRFIPGLKVRVTVVDSDDKERGTHELPFLWHPWLFHYGRNWAVPGEGEYTLKVEVEAPDFGRHDKENGKRYAQPVAVEFTGVKIKPGQK
ncbi:MAG: iron transporter [Ardenticatenales bacterium]|nr:iron transporter [Ardenticatenales bacterium]